MKQDRSFFKMVCNLAIPRSAAKGRRKRYTKEECVRYAISLVVFKKKNWMQSL